MSFSMANELSIGVADCIATELSVSPQDTLPVMSAKNQEILWLDDGTPYVVNYDDTTTYRVDLIFNDITNTDAGTIMDFWGSTSKANGMLNTFYWQHPTDGETYVARFISDPTHLLKAGRTTHSGVSNITLFISAKKAPSPSLLLEDGFNILLEDGGNILVEDGS